MKSVSLLIVSLALCFLVAIPACDKKDENPVASTSGPSGSLSFNTTAGNFAANGVFNLQTTSGSGAGWMNEYTIVAYNVVSLTNMSVAALIFFDTVQVGTQDLPYPAGFAWSLNANPSDTADLYAKTCAATSGSVNITTHAGGVTAGTFSGGGVFEQSQQSVTFTNGAFNINAGTGKREDVLPEAVLREGKRLLKTMRQ